jgi:tripartite-type tricarboxylate transporter receptor subunit TctC
VLTALAGASLPVLAQTQPRDGVIRCVAPFQAGGSSDVVLRSIVKVAAEKLNQPIIVDNKPGAGGAIGGLAVANAPADGSNILFATSTSTSGIVALNKRPAYDPEEAFTPLCLAGYYTTNLFVNADLPVKNVKELVEYGRANPNKLSYGSPHMTAQIAGAQLRLIGNMDAVEVPYKGEPALLPDLLTGRIQYAFIIAGAVVAEVQAGKLRMLATLLPARSPSMPNTPTMEEAGFPGFLAPGWGGFFGPKKMPADVRDRLARALMEAMASPAVQSAARFHQFFLAPAGPAELGKTMHEEILTLKRVVREARIPLE